MGMDSRELEQGLRLFNRPSPAEAIARIVRDESLPLERRLMFAHLARRAYGITIEVLPPAGAEPPLVPG